MYSYHAFTGKWDVIMVAPFAYLSCNICSSASFILLSSGCRPKSFSISSGVLAIWFNHRIYVPSNLAAASASIKWFMAK